MRLIKMTGGLGNQMFIYAFYLDMKRRFPRTRIDLSDMQHYHVHNGYELPDVFGLPREEFRMNRTLKKVLEFLFFRTVLERKQDPGTLRAFRRGYPWPLVYFKGFYQSERFFAASEREVRRAFTFREELAGPATRRMKAAIEADDRACSLHVRRGDYLQPRHWENTGSVCGPAYYRNAVAEMLRRRPEARFYVFSDDIAWVRAHLPLPQPATYIDWNRGKDSWQDMMLMSRCRDHVICNSSFSWWAAWLDQRADKVVVAPEKWYRHSPAPHILPDTWVKAPTE